MSAQDISYCCMIVSIAFACVCFGLLLLRIGVALKEAAGVINKLNGTVERVNITVDDVNHKLSLIDGPFELVNNISARNKKLGEKLNKLMDTISKFKIL